MILIPLAILMITPIAPMIVVIDVITPKTIPKIPPILSASILPARPMRKRIASTNLVGNDFHVH